MLRSLDPLLGLPSSTGILSLVCGRLVPNKWLYQLEDCLHVDNQASDCIWYPLEVSNISLNPGLSTSTRPVHTYHRCIRCWSGCSIDDLQRHCVEFANRALTSAEQKYTTSDKEYPAIIWVTCKFRHYLLGTSLTVETDHKPLRVVRIPQTKPWLLPASGTVVIRDAYIWLQYHLLSR